MTKFSRTVDYYGYLYLVNEEGEIDCETVKFPTVDYRLTENAHHRVHRIIAKAFPEICGVWFEGCHVHHINGNKLDNRAVNLVVLTPSAHEAIHEHERDCNIKPQSNSTIQKGFTKVNDKFIEYVGNGFDAMVLSFIIRYTNYYKSEKPEIQKTFIAGILKLSRAVIETSLKRLQKNGWFTFETTHNKYGKTTRFNLSDKTLSFCPWYAGLKIFGEN